MLIFNSHAVTSYSKQYNKRFAILLLAGIVSQSSVYAHTQNITLTQAAHTQNTSHAAASAHTVLQLTDNITVATNPQGLNQPNLARTQAQELMQQAQKMGLAQHPTWLRLHYYDSNQQSDTGKAETSQYTSKIDDSAFFVSANGKTNPQAELNAFITAMVLQTSQSPETRHNNSLLTCRFPARTHWVASQLNYDLPSQQCPEMDAWMQKLDPQMLSVVFAEEYPDRPVSAFGHTLLLIDSSTSLANPTAIDHAHALNDTVGGNDDDPFVVYSAKSFSGGYPNEITIDPYPLKLREYLQQDNRDVWTYRLNLTDLEVQQIMRHVWETKDLQLPYYFTTDNCASEILRYIDVVRPKGSLLDQFKVTIVPADVIRLLSKEGLITEQHYLPADNTLAQAQRNNPNLTNLPSSSISEDNTLIPTHLVPADNNALNAHARQRVEIGIGSQEETSYLSVAYRIGFHDLLDRPSGLPQNFHVEAGVIELRAFEDTDDNNPQGERDRVELQELTLLRGRSFNPKNTARSGESLLSSWGVTLQAKQVMDGSEAARHNQSRNEKQASNSHLVANAVYEKGLSLAFGQPKAGTGQLPPHLCYAFGNGSAQMGKGLNNGYRIGVGVNVGCRYTLNDEARLVGELQVPYWYHGDIAAKETHNNYWQPNVSLGLQYDLNKNNAIKLQGSYELQNRLEDSQDIRLTYIIHF